MIDEITEESLNEEGQKQSWNVKINLTEEAARNLVFNHKI